MKKILDRALTAVMVVCAVTMTGLAVLRHFSAPPGPAARELPRVEAWERLAAVGQVIGDPAAPVRIVEFADFQCPYCATVRERLRALRESNGGKVAVVYRHLPLTSIHPHAVEAAVASECAAAQQRFEPFHELLYARRDSIGKVPHEEFAARAGVPDAAAFRACMAGSAAKEAVRRDAEAAAGLGLNATPTFIVNGRMIVGAPAPGELEGLVQAALREAEAAGR